MLMMKKHLELSAGFIIFDVGEAFVRGYTSVDSSGKKKGGSKRVAINYIINKKA